jgi:4-amino-4-deoxy-L-arabinose transferase-like glycosyltransferase
LPWQRQQGDAPPTPDAITTPGYPLFLWSLPGFAPEPGFLQRVSLAQAGLGVLAVGLVLLIARPLGRVASLGAAALAALSPHLAVINTYVLTESLFVFMLLASTYASIQAARYRSLALFLLAGLLWGGCSLVRATTQFIPILAAGATLLIPRLADWRKPALVMLLGFAAAQAPWHIRNAITPSPAGQPNLMVSFLHHGSYPGFMFENRPESYGAPYRSDPNNEAVSRDLGSVLANIARHFRDEPQKYANWYLLGKPIALFSWNIIGGAGDIYTYPVTSTPYIDDPVFASIRKVALFLHWPLTALGFLGAISAIATPRRLRLGGEGLLVARVLAAVTLYAVAFHIIGAPFSRYGIPFRPFLLILALVVAMTPLRTSAAEEEA